MSDILSWTPRGRATATATALLGPLPVLSMYLVGLSSSLSPLWGRNLQRDDMVVVIIIHSIRSGDSPRLRRSCTPQQISIHSPAAHGVGGPRCCILALFAPGLVGLLMPYTAMP